MHKFVALLSASVSIQAMSTVAERVKAMQEKRGAKRALSLCISLSIYLCLSRARAVALCLCLSDSLRQAQCWLTAVVQMLQLFSVPRRVLVMGFTVPVHICPAA